MAGLLDFLNSEQGLLGMSLLAAAAPKERRTTIGEGLLQATQNVQAMRNAQEDRALKKRMADMQLAALEAQAQERKRLQEMEQRRGQYLGALDANQGPPMQPTAAGALAAGLSPQEYGMVAPQQAQAPQYKVVGGSLVKIGPDGVSEAYRAPEKADMNSLIVPGPDGKPTLNTLLLDAKRKIAQAGATNVGVSYGPPVQAIGPDGKPVFIQPTKDGSPPNIIPGVRPPMSAAEERESADKAAKARQAQQMMTAMSDARQILQKGTATASGIGTVRDAAGRAVGVTTAGAQDAARLQALSGWLVANVPRMEGPQSNYDVQNYMLMAGKIGDSTVPIKERLSALETVEKLQRKYAEINGSPMPAPAASSPSIDDLLKKYGD